MRATVRTRGVPAGRTLRLLSLLAVIALAGGCASEDATPGPASPTATNAPMSGAVATDLPPTPAPAEATAGPTAEPTEPATAKPGKAAPRWKEAKLPRWVEVGQPILLGDGRVFVIGYERGTTAVWNPATGKWTRAASLNKPRSAFAAIRLEDGRVLVAGGANTSRQSFSSAYTWDSDTDAWTKVGLMTQARTDPSIALLPDGRVLVAGGYFAIEQDWGMTPPVTAQLAVARPDGHAVATLAALTPPLADVEVPPWGRGLATTEIFDPDTGEWSKTRPMRYARSGAPMVTLADGRVLVVGSADENLELVQWEAFDTAELYDPSMERWAPAGNPLGGNGNLSAGKLVALDDGGAAVIGMSGWSKHESEWTGSFRFDASANAWRRLGKEWVATYNDPDRKDFMSPGPRWLGANVVRLGDGRILVAGGDGYGMETGRSTARLARLYDPATNAWLKLPRMASARAGGQAVLLQDGTAWILGGRNETEDEVEDVRTIARFYPGS